MTSEIRANTLKNRVGLGTVSFTNTGPVVSGIVTANSFSGPLITTSIDLNGDLDVDGHTNLDNVSIAGVTTMSGNLTISNTDPRIIFVDTNNNPDFTLHANGGEMQVENSGSGTQVKLESSGSTRLFGNVIANKDLDVDGHTNLDNVSIAGVSTFTGNVIVDSGTVRCNNGFSSDVDLYLNADANNNGSGSIIFQESGSEKLRINSSGELISTNGTLRRNVSDSSFTVSGDTASNTGANINLYGASHASLANIFRIRIGASEKLRITTDKVMFSADAKVDGNNTRDLGATGARWKGLYLGTELDIDTNDATDGHIMAKFNGVESGGNHAGLNIAHYLCGSDDNRTGLYWEHQNVSNERMWMGDDRRLYLKNSNPTSSTQNGRYIMTVAAGYPDFPSGSSADNAAYSALEIKKHYPNSPSGNYWIYDNNNTPRQIYCEMETDGGGWMLWHDHNYGQTSMNEALGGTGLNPSSNLARGNWGNYAYYSVWIKASQIDATGERLHSFVTLDGDGEIKYVADYGSDFLLENVGDQYQPNRNDYFNSGSTGEHVANTQMYQPQCGATGWENFSNGGNSAVFIREMDTRMAPGDHRSLHLVERIYNFDSNGVPFWMVAESMHPTPHWSDISLVQSEAADGNNPNIQTHNVEINSMNGNNGPSIRARSRGVLTGTFEYTFQLGYNWGWSIACLNATIGIENAIKTQSSDPYSAYTQPYYHASLYNNSSNNLWYPTSRAAWQSSDTSSSNSPGINYGNHVLWRESDGTIKARDKSGTHSNYTFPIKFAGPLIMCSGSQSPHYTKLQSVWNTGNTYDSASAFHGRNRWYK